MGKFLKTERSQLATPGPRRKALPALPSVPTAGTRKQVVSKYFENVRLSPSRLGLQVTLMRGLAEGVPLISALLVVVKPTPPALPEIKPLIPDNCHPFRIQ